MCFQLALVCMASRVLYYVFLSDLRDLVPIYAEKDSHLLSSSRVRMHMIKCGLVDFVRFLSQIFAFD